MKIFSKFQDYYDSTLGSFLESDVVVYRKTSTINVPYKEIPHFPVSTVAGHAGELIIGKLTEVDFGDVSCLFEDYEDVGSVSDAEAKTEG